MAEYDFDNLHIEIDNNASELGLDPWEALEIWHLGIEAFKNKKNVQQSVQGEPVDLAQKSIGERRKSNQ